MRTVLSLLGMSLLLLGIGDILYRLLELFLFSLGLYRDRPSAQR